MCCCCSPHPKRVDPNAWCRVAIDWAEAPGAHVGSRNASKESAWFASKGSSSSGRGSSHQA
eukprot:3933659-Amphidinium_carterae.3